MPSSLALIGKVMNFEWKRAMPTNPVPNQRPGCAERRQTFAYSLSSARP
jgi:hypothetical protein